MQAVSPELCASLIPAILAHPSKAAQPIGFYHAPAMFNFDARYMELAAHPSLISVAQRVIGGRTEPELNASSVPLENQLRLNDANGVVVEPGNRNGYWHCGKCSRSLCVFFRSSKQRLHRRPDRPAAPVPDPTLRDHPHRHL